MKTCSHCKAEKPLTEFHRNKSVASGYQSECKSCRKERAAKWNVEHKGIATERSRAYREKHPDRYVAYAKKYALENKAKISEASKRRRLPIQGMLNEKSKAWKHANPEKCKDYKKRWRASNRELVNEQIKRQKERRRVHGDKYSKLERANLRDNYVKAQLCARGAIPRSNIPNDLIEAKRLHLQIIRKLKELKA